MLDPTSWISNEPNQVQVNQQKHRNWTIGVHRFPNHAHSYLVRRVFSYVKSIVLW